MRNNIRRREMIMEKIGEEYEPKQYVPPTIT
jgi:hypothetical protein